jgi:peptidyl-prolyl cis-trans isomerase C
MNTVRKAVFTALCATLVIGTLQTMPVSGAEEKPAEQKQTEPAKTSPKDPVAKVGDTIITRGELDRAEAILVKQNPPQQPLTSEQTKQITDYLIEQLVSAELLYQSGLKLEVKELEKKVEDKITQARAGYAKPEEFEAVLKAQDIDEKLLREYTRKEIIVNNLIEKEIIPKVKVSDEEILKFYNDNKERYFSKPEQVRASHILIGVDQKADEETKKKAKEKAEAVLKEVKEGKKDFAELAKSNSTCPSKDQGGDLGPFGKGQMVKPFEDAAFALKQGEVSGIVETQFGYHIIKLTEKKASENVSLDEAKTKIAEFLKGQKIQGKVAEYINEVKGKIKVEKLLK